MVQSFAGKKLIFLDQISLGIFGPTLDQKFLHGKSSKQLQNGFSCQKLHFNKYFQL